MPQKETALLNAYLIVGSDELKAQTVIKRLWTRLESLGNIDFNSQTLDGSKDIDVQELLDSLNTPPLAAPYRLVLIKEVDKGGKQLAEALITYLESPMPSTILAMTALKLTQQSRLYKAVKKIDAKAVIEAADPRRSELPAMVRQLAKSYQITLSHDAAARLADLVGTSTVALNTEIKKLASYVLALDRSEAGLADVNAVISRSNQPSNWDFVDAVSQRDLIKSFEILTYLSRESPVSLLYLVVTRLREMLQYKSLAARKDGMLAKALGKPDWQLRRLEALSSKFEAAELRELLAQSAQADARMKSGEDAHLVLEEIVLSACKQKMR